MSKQLVFASHNKGKVKEIQTMLAPLDIEVLSADDLQLPDVAETGMTFEQNAEIKALAAAKESGLPALGDDSGLCIHALDNEPGLFSARYAKKCGGYPEAFADIAKRLADKADKTAHFECTMVLAFPNGVTHTYVGRVDGRIVSPQKGDYGFGYDPIFMPEGYTQTFAVLGDNIKNKISHRSRALAAFMDDFKRVF